MAGKGNNFICAILSLYLLSFVSCQTNIHNGGIPEMDMNMKTYFESFIEERLSRFASKSKDCNDVVVLKERMAQLESEMMDLKNKNNDLIKEVEMLKSKQIQTEKIVRVESSGVVADVIQADGEQTRMNSLMNGVNNITSGVLKGLPHPSSGVNKAENDNTPRIRRGTPIYDSSIFFSANVAPSLSNLGVDQTIIFRHSITNIGHHYNEQTGIFTCPESGTYVFHTSIYVNEGQWVHFNIVQKGAVVSWGLTNSQAANIVGSKLVIVHLEKNDRVWVKVQLAGGTSAIIIDSVSSFSGFKI